MPWSSLSARPIASLSLLSRSWRLPAGLLWNSSRASPNSWATESRSTTLRSMSGMSCFRKPSSSKLERKSARLRSAARISAKPMFSKFPRLRSSSDEVSTSTVGSSVTPTPSAERSPGSSKPVGSPTVTVVVPGSPESCDAVRISTSVSSPPTVKRSSSFGPEGLPTLSSRSSKFPSTVNVSGAVFA